MSFIARSQEEIDYLSNLETITFIICDNGVKKYYILVEESVSKFVPCYLNKFGKISGYFDIDDYIDSYEDCINIITQKYNIISEKDTISVYAPFESRS